MVYPPTSIQSRSSLIGLLRPFVVSRSYRLSYCALQFCHGIIQNYYHLLQYFGTIIVFVVVHVLCRFSLIYIATVSICRHTRMYVRLLFKKVAPIVYYKKTSFIICVSGRRTLACQGSVNSGACLRYLLSRGNCTCQLGLAASMPRFLMHCTD